MTISQQYSCYYIEEHWVHIIKHHEHALMGDEYL